ncbi:MAG: hypothetical protein RJA48_1919, partial [Verrucomicrobiota bacterium]
MVRERKKAKACSPVAGEAERWAEAGVARRKLPDDGTTDHPSATSPLVNRARSNRTLPTISCNQPVSAKAAAA